MFAHGVRDCVHSHMNCFGNFWICKKELVVTIIFWAIGPPIGGFLLKEGSLVSRDFKSMSKFLIWSLV